METGKSTVHLAVKGNDMNAIETKSPAQQMEIRFGKGKKFQTVKVETLNQASAIWGRFIAEGNYGASDGYQAYIFVDGIRRAKVSYNGKVFTMGGEKVFDPYEVAA